MEEALVRMLQPGTRKKAKVVKLPVFAGSGLLPGVDLDDSSELLELMERE
jgi:hypothetical protein